MQNKYIENILYVIRIKENAKWKYHDTIISQVFLAYLVTIINNQAVFELKDPSMLIVIPSNDIEIMAPEKSSYIAYQNNKILKEQECHKDIRSELGF